MIVRIWRVGIRPERINELEHFAHTNSLSMFQEQEGCLGVLFTLNDRDCVTISLWENAESIERLKSSSTYIQTARLMEATGMLEGAQSVELFQSFGGFTSPDKLSEALGAGIHSTNHPFGVMTNRLDEY